jgi:hypothetical protein
MDHNAGAALGTGIVVAYMGIWAFMMLFIFASLIASALAVYDCAKRDFPDPNSRALWCLLLLLIHGIGAIIYYYVIYRHGYPPYEPAVGAMPPPPPKMPPPKEN